MMSYEDAIEDNPIVTRAVAERECKRHNTTMDALIKDLGDLCEYYAADLLCWLGY